ncbi:hypothetical protein DWF00_04290 [Bosea caraganae]|uniref:Uncharacterized protein n=1 Tax=Bosea caraganae TaxID=2763117 RepID=A0A370KXX2_9HYPH|nr:hypothetical protein [Bosea caraganae]RDJ19827.1 hypothetical protein DWE98_27830 [Bosea caraganae]RDJ30032.1 hypothetical protein DWF00_04290 [Bosea caraganae]
MRKTAQTLQRPDWQRGIHRIGQRRDNLAKPMTAFVAMCPDFRETLELYDHACLAFEFWLSQSGDSAQELQTEYSDMCEEMLQDILRFFPQD